MVEASPGEFCKEHGISRMTLSRWRHRGYVKVTPGGAIDVAATDALLRDAGLGRFRERADVPDGALAEAERAREIALARLRQAQLRRRRRDWLEVEHCRIGWRAAAEHTKASLRAIVPDLVTAAAGKDQLAAFAAIRDVVYRALEALAATEFQDTAGVGSTVKPLRTAAPLREARTARVAAIAELRALDLAITEGRVVSAQAFDSLGIHFSNTRNMMLGLPNRLAPLVAGVPASTVEPIVRAALESILADLPDEMPDKIVTFEGEEEGGE